MKQLREVTKVPISIDIKVQALEAEKELAADFNSKHRKLFTS